MRTATGTCSFCDGPFEYQVKAGPRPIYCSSEHRWKAAYQQRKRKWQTLTERRCSRCKLTKPIAEFPGPHCYCRSCHAVRAREWREIHSYDPEFARIMTLRRYGLTPAQFNALLEAQGHRCAVCRTAKPGGQGWHVDHDHTCCNTRKRSCGRCIRGILCTRCNIGIGNFKDDPDIIQAAINYITAYRTRRLSSVK